MHINLKVHFGTFLLDPAILSEVQQICANLAPSWSSKLHVYDSPNGKPKIRIDTSDTLYNTATSEVFAEEPFYKKLVSRFGSPKFTGTHGTVEFRGCNSSITIVLGVDERRFVQVGDIWIWGNYISFQLRAPQIEGRSAAEFAEILFKELCKRLPVWYGHAEATKEFDAKNISREGGGVAAIGVDISKALPGLYWLNFFGPSSVNNIGREKFEAVATFNKYAIGDGIMLSAGDNPADWGSPERSTAEAGVIAVLGEKYFFLRAAPSRNTHSPFNVS